MLLVSSPRYIFSGVQAIIEACKAMTSPDPIPLGEYLGFSMKLLFDTFSKDYRILFRLSAEHSQECLRHRVFHGSY